MRLPWANAEILLGDLDFINVDAGRRREGALDESEPLAVAFIADFRQATDEH